MRETHEHHQVSAMLETMGVDTFRLHLHVILLLDVIAEVRRCNGYQQD
jgi:hypothetical protein